MDDLGTIQSWARRLYEQDKGKRFWRHLSVEVRLEVVYDKLTPFGASQQDIQAIAQQIGKLIRDNARPAGLVTPRRRGNRMYEET